jgi:spore germination cell wall hydrolase CwlJ-like protein
LTESTNRIATTLAWWLSRIVKLVSLFMVVAVVVSVTSKQFATFKSQNEAWQLAHVSVQEKTRQLECLTRNIYWESASEPFEGKVAVAQVTMNRVASGRFPADVCGVVYQKNIVYEKVICQFSWYCEGTYKTKPVHGVLWRESEEVAKKVLLEGFRLPSMKNALYYHADYIHVQWNKPEIARIGHHVFYGDKL